ncbi:MAG: DUF4330 domain-containing protein [Bacillota bacterium]|nr:DUF4330 domain-containing protein [Bacillota bacterium]
MKIIDKQGKLFGIINVIDFAVLMVVVLFAGFVLLKMGPSDSSQITTQVHEKMQYTVKVEEVSEFTIDGAHIGDAVYDYETGSNIGVITAVYEKPFMEYVVDENNDATAIESVDKYNLFVTVEADFVETDRANMVEDTVLAVGRKILVYNKYLFVEGIIYSWDSDFND